MANAEYIVEIDQDLYYTFLLSDEDAAKIEGETAVAAPVLALLSPNTAIVGADPVTVVLSGTGFSDISRVNWNGGIEKAKVFNSIRIDMTVDPRTASGAFTIPVSVLNSTEESNSLDFTFTEAVEE